MSRPRKPIDLAAIQPDVLYPAEQAAAICGRDPKTLANERCQRRGPPVTYVGRRPLYLGKDLREYLMRGRVDFETAKPEPRRRGRR